MYLTGQALQHNCSDWFEDSFDANLAHIKSYNTKLSFKPLFRDPDFTVVDFPVIVTAANSAFFGVSQGLIQSIYTKVLPNYKQAKLILYDIGLTNAEREKVLYIFPLFIIQVDLHVFAY